MKFQKGDPPGQRKFRLSYLLLTVAGVYLIFFIVKFPRLLEIVSRVKVDLPGQRRFQPLKHLIDQHIEVMVNITSKKNNGTKMSMLERLADEAWSLGSKAWEEAENYNIDHLDEIFALENRSDASCPQSISKTRADLVNTEHIIFIPCGLTTGSSVTVVGILHSAKKHLQFTLNLQGMKSEEGDSPQKILYLNHTLTRNHNSSIHKLVIDHNTYCKKQWGKVQRCDGSPSVYDDHSLIDGHTRCENRMHNEEGQMLNLSIHAGVEGYHISIAGQHFSSFLYSTGCMLEDATSLVIKGDVEVQSIFATSLPTSNLNSSPLRVLEMSENWKTLPLKKKTTVKLFIGVVSTANHFSERMSVRKTWMQYPDVKSSEVVVRFFVALSESKEINLFLKKEAAYFGDTLILPYIDRYELVVLKTIAVCEYGVNTAKAAFVMKCDDDTFVKLDTLLRWINAIPTQKPLYLGKLNYLIKPIRETKWAVTYEEWPEDVFPPFANGPAYIISRDIAEFVIQQRNNQSLRLFKLEDVSMGMWVQQFNNSGKHVKYSHNWKFCQYGCKRGCFTAHYQSPRQMLCLWDNVIKDHIICCNFK